LQSFTVKLMQAHCSILPSIADKTKHRNRKSTHLKTMHVHSMADWCNRLSEVWRWPPLSSTFTETVTTITIWEFADTTSYSGCLWAGQGI
jgi:hypothetical protein